jgi:hypothetical protein
MPVVIAPQWDPSGSVGLRVDASRGELVVSGGGQVTELVLRRERPERLGWSERQRNPGGRVRHRRVSVGEALCHCLREWEAEQEVLRISREAAERAIARGGGWREAGLALRDQCAEAGRGSRVSVLPFQVLCRQLTEAAPEPARLSKGELALRAGYVARGIGDVVRLERRLGLREQSKGAVRARSRFVNYETGLALCRALDRDPVELGL